MAWIKDTTSVCSQCLVPVPATVFEEGGQVLMHKACPDHGEERALLASDPAFYYQASSSGGGGCGPAGCGLLNHSCTLMFEITDRCNLSCPTCFSASTPDKSWFMSLEEFESQLDRLRAAGKQDADIVQLSGGEPTIHPDLVRMIEACFERGVEKVYLNTNGIELGRTPELAERLAQFAGRLQIYLQFDGFRSSTFGTIRGAGGLLDLKLKAVEHCIAQGIYVLPVMTVTRGVNLDEIGALARFVLEHHPGLNALMLQPAMYAGRYLTDQYKDRITVGDIAKELERQTDGMFSQADFGPIPCSDPNCFSMAVGLVQDGKVLPISRYFPRYESWSKPEIASRIDLISDRLPQHMMEALADDEVVDELLDLLIDGEASQLTDFTKFFLVAIKPFMDAHTYDQDRVDKCCVHVVDRAGNPVSLCEYNTLRRPQGLL